MLGAVKSVCLVRSGFARTYLAFVLIVTLFMLSSAQVSNWTKQPTDPLFGVHGENISLEWNFTLTGNDNIYEFKLQQLKNSNQDIVSYQPGSGRIWVAALFKGKFALATNATHPAFILVNAETNDEAKYCCRVSTTKGHSDENCINLQILVLPSITGILKNQTWNETNDVTLRCNATGKPPPNVTWSNPENQDVKYSESVNALLLKNISREQDGDYWCTASNRVGKVTASVRVNVHYAPSVTSNSTRYNFTEGSDIKLSCVADGRPQPTITWTKIGESSDVGYPDTQTLIIANANRTKAGAYKCTANNGIGESASASMRVNMFFPPSIHQGPANTTVNETSDLELLCNATGNPLPAVTWSKVTDPSVQLSVDEVLKVKNISKTDSGVYQCRASNGIGNDALASSTVTVNYKPKETRLTSDAHKDAVKESFQVTFYCTADSVPPPELELRFRNSSLGLFVNDMFTLVNINASNQGTYECVARNILGTGPTATLNLTILVSASIDYISQNTTANETDDLMLFCNSTGNPTPNITWTFLGNSANIGVRESLTLQHVNRSQAGTYRCTSTNGAMNRASADVHVQVNYKPEIKDGPSVITSWINRKTHVSCEAEGFPAPEIFWTLKGTITTSTTLNSRVSTLQFTPQEESEFGILLCKAKNVLGTANRNITLKQLVVPSAPEILRIDVGLDNMEIHWKASTVDPDSPVLNYLVQIKEKDETEHWMNCTRITVQKSSGTMLCVMNKLKSGTEYIVRVAARNVVGYSDFTKKQSSTKGRSETKEEQKGLPRSAIDGIIAGVICFLALIVIICAIVKHRRSRSRGSNKKFNYEIPDINESTKKVTVTSYDNPTMESEVSTTGAPQRIFNC